VWVGFDDGHPMRAGASQLAVPLWREIMQRALARAPEERFDVPSGVELVSIERASGLRAAPGCGPAITEAFLVGTAPQISCADERPVAARREARQEEGPRPLRELRDAVPRALGWLAEHLGLGGR
jgi:penicillin-binding protein 1A